MPGTPSSFEATTHSHLKKYVVLKKIFETFLKILQVRYSNESAMDRWKGRHRYRITKQKNLYTFQIDQQYPKGLVTFLLQWQGSLMDRLHWNYHPGSKILKYIQVNQFCHKNLIFFTKIICQGIKVTHVKKV